MQHCCKASETYSCDAHTYQRSHEAQRSQNLGVAGVEQALEVEGQRDSRGAEQDHQYAGGGCDLYRQQLAMVRVHSWGNQCLMQYKVKLLLLCRGVLAAHRRRIQDHMHRKYLLLMYTIQLQTCSASEHCHADSLQLCCGNAEMCWSSLPVAARPAGARQD